MPVAFLPQSPVRRVATAPAAGQRPPAKARRLDGAGVGRLQAAFSAHAPAAVQALFGDGAPGALPSSFALPSGAGQALPDGLRQSAERFFQSDFSSVRLHVGPEAAAIGAHAFAAGDRIVFAPGALDTSSARGREVLGHELAHVVQQRAGRVRSPSAGLSVVDEPALEAEANRLGRAMAGASASQTSAAAHAEGGGDPGSVGESSTAQRCKVVQRMDFNGPTVGVEQELSGVKLACDDRDRGVIGEVRNGGEVLVEFTTDMGGDGLYTIELRTTPCVKANALEVEARKTATRVMLGAITSAGQDRRAVDGDMDLRPADHAAGFRIKILQPRHSIRLEGSGDFSFSNQISMGVGTDALAVGDDPDADFIRNYAARTWYDQDLAERLPVEGLEEPGKARGAYALVASVITFLARLRREQGEGALDGSDDIAAGLHTPKTKNRWGVLPRTPPWQWLKVLTAHDMGVVKAFIREEFSAERFDQAAYRYIMSEQDLAGHQIPAATINEKHSSVFEFREVPNELAPFVYGAHIPEAMSGPPTRLPPWAMDAILKRRPAQTDDSESSDDSDWDG